MTPIPTITRDIAVKLRDTVDAGLVAGVGRQIPGQMCVEAAVCFALGLPHGDDPRCVAQSLRRLKIRLNDASKNQPPYLPLPAYSNERETISCWKLTWRERWRVLFGGRLWLRQMNFGNPLQPQAPCVESPFVEGAK